MILIIINYYCYFYSQKELGFAKSYLHFFLEKAINRLVRPVQKNNIKLSNTNSVIKLIQIARYTIKHDLTYTKLTTPKLLTCRKVGRV